MSEQIDKLIIEKFLRGDVLGIYDEECRVIREHIKTLTAKVEALTERNNEAIDVIHTWHGDDAWDIYRDMSPEMKRITGKDQPI